MLEAAAAALGAVLIGIALLDALETIVLPRRVMRQFRLTRFFFLNTWRPWAAFAPRVPSASRETYLSFYGTLFLILLVGPGAPFAQLVPPLLKERGASPMAATGP